MYMFHSTLRINPDFRQEFESRFQPDTHPIHEAPGFLRRMMLKDKDNPGRYFYVSIWESLEHLQAYRASEGVQAQYQTIPDGMYDGPVDRVECELVGGVLEK